MIDVIGIRFRVAGVAAAAAVVALALSQAIEAQGRAQAQKAGAGPTLVLETVKGTIEIELFQEDAPKTVARIGELARKNFYNGLRFHRVENNLVQIGDPVSRDMSREAYWGRTGSGTAIGVAEISKRRRHLAGAVAMAHAGDPKFADSQFYITKRATPSLDGKHAVFGRVTRGMEVVTKLEKGDILKKAFLKP